MCGGGRGSPGVDYVDQVKVVVVEEEVEREREGVEGKKVNG